MSTTDKNNAKAEVKKYKPPHRRETEGLSVVLTREENRRTILGLVDFNDLFRCARGQERFLKAAMLLFAVIAIPYLAFQKGETVYRDNAVSSAIDAVRAHKAELQANCERQYDQGEYAAQKALATKLGAFVSFDMAKKQCAVTHNFTYVSPDDNALIMAEASELYASKTAKLWALVMSTMVNHEHNEPVGTKEALEEYTANINKCETVPVSRDLDKETADKAGIIKRMCDSEVWMEFIKRMLLKYAVSILVGAATTLLFAAVWYSYGSRILAALTAWVCTHLICFCVRKYAEIVPAPTDEGEFLTTPGKPAKQYKVVPVKGKWTVDPAAFEDTATGEQDDRTLAEMRSGVTTPAGENPYGVRRTVSVGNYQSSMLPNKTSFGFCLPTMGPGPAPSAPPPRLPSLPPLTHRHQPGLVSRAGSDDDD